MTGTAPSGAAGGLPGAGESRAGKPPRKVESPSRRRGGLPGDDDCQVVAPGVVPEGSDSGGVDSAEAWGRARLDTYGHKWVTDAQEGADTSRQAAMVPRRTEWAARAKALEELAARLRDRHREAPHSGAGQDALTVAAILVRRARRWRARVRWATTPMDRLMDGCGQVTTLVTACGCGARRLERRCDQRWSCARCRKRWCRRQRARLWHAMSVRRDRSYLVTPTVRHSGDPAADWTRLQQAWRVWRRWLARQLGESPAYVRLWEATGGRDDLGHVHCHAVVYARRIDYGDAVAAWRRAVGDPAGVIDFRVVRDPKQAVRYLSKYVTKGVDLGSMSPEVAGKLEAAAYGRRMVSSSRSFFQTHIAKCSRCACRFSIPAPDVWGAQVRRVRADALLVAYATGEVLDTGPPGM